MKYLKKYQLFERFFDIGDLTDYSTYILDEIFIKFENDVNGVVKIRVPDDNEQFEKFEIYDDGKVKLENWYPSDLHIKIVGHIYNNIDTGKMRERVKNHLIYLINKKTVIIERI